MSKYLKLSVTTLAVSAVLGTLLLLLLKPGFAQSESASKTDTSDKGALHHNNRHSPVAESGNNSMLRALLSDDKIIIDDETLLAPSVEKTRTVQIRLTNQQPSEKNEFSADKPVNTGVSLYKSEISGEGLARQRRLELSPQQILVVSLDKKQRVLWWSLENDPRLLRLETSDESGRLSGGNVIYQNDAELLVSLPADSAITDVRLYHPNWDGSKFQLEAIGSLELPKR